MTAEASRVIKHGNKEGEETKLIFLSYAHRTPSNKETCYGNDEQPKGIPHFAKCYAEVCYSF